MLSQSDAAPAEQYQTSRKLTELLQSCSENQSCADCKSRLMDSIWASTTVGAFLCIHCAGAHRTLGVQLSRVKSIHLDTWTDEEVAAMKGGNKGVNEVYSKYLDKWIAADASLELLPNTATDVREKCIRAKYQDKQFTRLPSQVDKKDQDRPENPEQLSPSAASSAVNTEAASAGPNQQLSPGKTAQLGNSAVIKPGSVVEVTKRLLNYFIVVGRGALVADQKIETTKSPTEIRFLPTVIDAYPDTHGDAPVPAHIGEFAFPEGFALSKSYVAPVFFSFVLTNVSGVKIYACALKFYEELHPLEVVSLITPHYHRQRHRRQSSSNGALQQDEVVDNQRTQLPQWVQDLSGDVTSAPGPVFCPKCIVVTSHYPYFSAFRQFLQQIYRVTLSESPMPIERYIANFLTEIPLPPPGQIQVQLTLPDRNLIISRPPKNELPLVDFPFRPLFQVLDLNNVLLVFTCVALELKVVLCSKRIGLLTPVAEALLSILLPFSWQGAYIPVLPTSLLDVIDAPVPFIVGTHSGCLKQLAGRTTNVVFIDLDHNRVIPAVSESGKTVPVPKLPEREGAKLRAKLAGVAGIFDPYAAGINRVDQAFPNEEHLEPIGNFDGQTVPLSTSYSESSMADSLNSHYSIGKIKRPRRSSGPFNLPSPSLTTSSSGFTRTNSGLGWPSFSSSASATSSPRNDSRGLMDSKTNESDSFSTEGVRKAFLRFFVTLLKKYANYLNPPSTHVKSGEQDLFDSKRFLQENFDNVSRPFVALLISTQMFDRFIEDRVFNPKLPEVLFFDQSINQKLNRSLTIGKKKYDCSFLEDRSDEIQETFIAPPPSNIGLPDDGTIYKYKSFPRLKKTLFGNVRKPRELYTSREQQRNVSRVTFNQALFKAGRSAVSGGTSWEATRHLIVSLQKQFRMYIVRKVYRRQRNAAISIQRQVVAKIKGKAGRLRFLAFRRGAIMIQKIYRMHDAMRKYRAQHNALLKLQFTTKGYIVYARYQRVLRGFRCLQAVWRGSIFKCSYKNLKLQAVKVQSCARGVLSRKRATRWKIAMFEAYRRKIYDLWDQGDTSLLYRSTFWVKFKTPDFFTIGVYQEEEARLQATCSHGKTFFGDHPHLSEQRVDGAKRDEIRGSKLTAIQRMISPKQPKVQKFGNTLSSECMKIERGKVYTGLKYRTSPSVRMAYFEKFGIKPDSKKRKKKLAALVWTSFDTVDISAEVVITASAGSEEAGPTSAQIERQKERRLRDNLAFTVNAALKSIRSSPTHIPRIASPSRASTDRSIAELQRQVRSLTLQNKQLTDELAASEQMTNELRTRISPQPLQRTPSSTSTA